jgi:hypothetical protein
MGCHHAEGLLDAQVKGVAHALGDMPPKGAQATRQRTLGLRHALLDLLADLEGGGLQILQILSRGVVGRLHYLGLGGRVP